MKYFEGLDSFAEKTFDCNEENCFYCQDGRCIYAIAPIKQTYSKICYESEYWGDYDND